MGLRPWPAKTIHPKRPINVGPSMHPVHSLNPVMPIDPKKPNLAIKVHVPKG